MRCFQRSLLRYCIAGAVIPVLAIAGCSSAVPSVAPGAPASKTAAVQVADDWHYALVIDASSSASALQIFQWRPRSGGRLPQIEAAPFPRQPEDKTWETRVKPGLGDFAGRPEEAARSLVPLIDFAFDKIGSDSDRLASTTLLLRATAGMRLLSTAEQSAIMGAVERYLETLPFGSASARIISGEEEGIFGWIAVNYLLGHLEHGGPFPTVGALDLGGASSQITFVPLDYPRGNSRAVRIGRNTYHLYTHSYLGLGQDQARAAVGSPDCFLRGFPLDGGGTGNGDFESCRQTIVETFSRPCAETPCTAFGVYQPPLYGDFLAFSVYAYAADFFELDQQLVPEEIAARGTAFCARSWQEMVAGDPEVAENPYLPTYCYAAAHITALLTDGFGFTDDTERITAPLRVQGSSVGWALGALVYELAGDSN